MARRRTSNAEKLDAIAPDVTIAGLKPAGGGGGGGGSLERVRVRIGRGKEAVSLTLDADAARDAGLAVGQRWGGPESDVAARVRRAVALTDARSTARRVLARTVLSTGRLSRRLREKGCEGWAADRVVAELVDAGLLDDAALAGATARSLAERRPSGKRVIEMKLREKGIDAAAARDAADAAAADRDEFGDALAVARKKRRSLDRFDEETRRRRLIGALARRGFGGDTARRAIDQAEAEAAEPSEA